MIMTGAKSILLFSFFLIVLHCQWHDLVKTHNSVMSVRPLLFLGWTKIPSLHPLPMTWCVFQLLLLIFCVLNSCLNLVAVKRYSIFLSIYFKVFFVRLELLWYWHIILPIAKIRAVFMNRHTRHMPRAQHGGRAQNAAMKKIYIIMIIIKNSDCSSNTLRMDNDRLCSQ